MYLTIWKPNVTNIVVSRWREEKQLGKMEGQMHVGCMNSDFFCWTFRTTAEIKLFCRNVFIFLVE